MTLTSADRKISVRRVLVNDHLSSLAWMLIVMFWFLSVLLPEERQSLVDRGGWLEFLIIVTVLLSAALVWRIHRASTLFRFGRVATARITWVSVAIKGPITYNFKFELEGRWVRAHMNVVGWKRKPVFKQRAEVEVLYDPARPTRAIIPYFFRA
jgi:uncharacterized membrane protein YhdT